MNRYSIKKFPDITKFKQLGLAAMFRGFGAFSILFLYLIASLVFKPAEAAPLYFIITVATVSVQVMLMGVNTYSVKLLAGLSGSEKIAQFVSSILYISIKRSVLFTIFGTVTSIVGVVFFSIDPSYVLIVPTLILVIPTSAMIASLFQGLRRYNTSIFIMSICTNAILCGLVGLYGVFKSYSVNPQLFIVPAAFITLVVAFLLLERHIGTGFHQLIKMRNSVPIGREAKLQMARFWIVLVLVNLGLWLPQIAYYFHGDRQDYAFYSVSERLANAINFFLIVSQFFLAPIIAKAHSENNYDELRDQVIKILRAATVASFPVAAVMVLLPSPVLSIFGKDYSDGSVYLIIMASTQFFNVISGAANTILNMTGNETRLIWTIGVALLLELLLIMILGPWLGGVGYAIAYAVNIVTQNILGAIVIRQRLGLNIFATFVGKG